MSRQAAVAGKIERAEARSGVIGRGYVGLPLAFAQRGFSTIGFDIDPAKIEA